MHSRGGYGPRGSMDVMLRASVLFLTLSVLGCATVFSYLSLSQDERRLFEIYSVFMTTAQQAEYLSRTTPADRAAYAKSLGLHQRFLALSEGERDAVLSQRLMGGMSADALLMSWGQPWYRFRLGEDDEKWMYFPYFSRHLPPSVGYRVYLRGGRVYEWVQFVIPAPERGASRRLNGAGPFG